MKVGIIGLGLIGGSLAIAIREVFPDAFLVALNRSGEPLEAAAADGVIDKGVHEITEDFRDCDYIFLCAPVHTNISFLAPLKPYLTEKTILSDVGSVKSEIHDAVSEYLPEACFIGGHPMAGREKVGYRNASSELIKGCYYYLTPSPSSPKEAAERMADFIRQLGCRPILTSPKQHDYIVAAISHVPHLAAFMLVKLVRDADSPEEYMRYTAAGGFKDTTRIASSDPTMWEQIFLSNRDNILELTDRYIEDLQQMRELIAGGNGEALHKAFEESRDYRNSIIEKKEDP